MKGVIASAIIAVMGVLLWRIRNPRLPEQPHKPTPMPWKYYDNFFPVDLAQRIVKRIQSVDRYPMAGRDAPSMREDAGEAVPIGPNRTCAHPLLVPNKNNTVCALPQRIDIGIHYLRTGGDSGAKELYEDLLNRIQPFTVFSYVGRNDSDLEELYYKLYQQPSFVQEASSVCGNNTVFYPIQFDWLILLPGHVYPLHLDGSWFRFRDPDGSVRPGNRFGLPQWLTIVMEESGLFEEERVDQIQGVLWLSNVDPADGGEYFFYPEGPSEPRRLLPPRFNRAAIMDGSRIIHGANRLVPSAWLPRMPKFGDNALVFAGDEMWELQSEGTVLERYHQSELRLSFVWRALCFATQEEADEYDTQHRRGTQVSVEEVLDRLIADLRRRGRLGPEDPRPEPIDLALMLVDEYVAYPLGNQHKAIFPYNYCALYRLLEEGSLLHSIGAAVLEWWCAPPENPPRHAR